MSANDTVVTVLEDDEEPLSDTRLLDTPVSCSSNRKRGSKVGIDALKRRIIEERNAVFDREIIGQGVERKPVGPYPFEDHEIPICIHVAEEGVMQYGAAKNQVFTDEEREYGEMSIEEWEEAGIEICSQASALIQRLAALRRKRVGLVSDIQTQLHDYSQRLEAQDKSLHDKKRQVQYKAKGFLDDAMVLYSELKDM